MRPNNNVNKVRISIMQNTKSRYPETTKKLALKLLSTDGRNCNTSFISKLVISSTARISLSFAEVGVLSGVW